MDKKWWVLASMCLLTVMLNIDVTALNIAIPVISQEFYASLSEMQWVINAYVLLSAMLQILGGKLGDNYGHKKIFLYGTALFILSSAGAGLSVDATMLIAFRVLQGISLGIAYPMTIVLTFAAFHKSQQGFALSFIVGAMGFSLAIGPPIGGFLVDTIGWRWIFYINIPVGLLCFFLAAIFCSKKKIEKSGSIDYKGAALLILALFGVTFALNQVQDWGFSSPSFLIVFFLGILFLFLLYWSEKRHKDPIVEFKLFGKRNFLLNNLIRIPVQLIFVPLVFFVPLYLQNVSEFSPIASGLIVMSTSVAIAILSPIAGKWVDRVGDKIPNIVSMALFLAGSLLFLLVTPEPNLIILTMALVLVGIAVGIAFVSTITGALSVVSEEKQGAATGILFTNAWLGCALGVAISGAIIAMTSQSALFDLLAGANASLSSDELEIAQRVARGISPLSEISDPSIQPLAAASYIEGFHRNAWYWAGISFVGLLLAIALKKPPRGEKTHVDILVP